MHIGVPSPTRNSWKGWPTWNSRKACLLRQAWVTSTGNPPTQPGIPGRVGQPGIPGRPTWRSEWVPPFLMIPSKKFWRVLESPCRIFSVSNLYWTSFTYHHVLIFIGACFFGRPGFCGGCGGAVIPGQSAHHRVMVVCCHYKGQGGRSRYDLNDVG